MATNSLPILTIVVPWRGDPQLNRLLKRVSGATSRSDFEVVVAVDGELTPEFEEVLSGCLALEQERTCVRVVVSSEASGPGQARNRGLQDATTEFVCFADSDDLPDFDALVRAAQHMREHRIQVLVGGYTVARDAQIIKEHTPLPDVPFRDELINVAGVWRFIFETAYLKDTGIAFARTSYGEDALFLIEIQARTPTSTSWPRVLYTYCDSPSPSRLTNSKPSMGDLEEVAHRLWQLLRAADTGTRDLASFWLVRIAVHQRLPQLLRDPDTSRGRFVRLATSMAMLQRSARMHLARRAMARADRPTADLGMRRKLRRK